MNAWIKKIKGQLQTLKGLTKILSKMTLYYFTSYIDILFRTMLMHY